MKHSALFLLMFGGLAVAVQPATDAHFQLLEPASWLIEDDRGDPQKLGPCGGDPSRENEQLLTGAVTEVTGGSELHLKIQETDFSLGPLPRRTRGELTERTAAGSDNVREVHG